MKHSDLGKAVSPGSRLSDRAWIDTIEDIAEDHGYFEPLGPDHSIAFIERGPRLLVTFETIDSIRARNNMDVPLGWALLGSQDWSQLCVLSHGETWFRHRALYGHFDRMIDDAVFDAFDQVVFYGAESCGYGAAAFSVAAPGATVIALSPQATLDPRIAEWDDRFVHMRRTSFTDRYGYAPDMIEAARRAYVLYDPTGMEEAMHAALFNSANVSRIRCANMDGQIEHFLLRLGLLPPLIRSAMAGTLNELEIFRALRARRDYLPYLRNFLNEVEGRQRPWLSAVMCRSLLRRIRVPRFRHQYARAIEALGTRPLPPPRERAAHPQQA